MRVVSRVVLVCGLLTVLVSCAVPVPFSSPLPGFSPVMKPQTEGPTQQTSVPPAIPTAAAADNVLPEKGKAALSGALYSLNFQRTIPKTAFYLIPAAEDKQPPMVLTGPHKDKGDVIGFSDDQGKFILDNIPPGDYFMVVWAPLNWILAVSSPTDETPRLISLGSNESIALGTVNFPWP